MGAFELLSEPVVRAAGEFGLSKPTEPQELAIPHVLQGKNVLLIAPTGTGKTEAALLPIFSMCLGREWVPGVKILYIAPLRALNRDMLARLARWGDRLDLRMAIRHGDTPQSERRKQVEEPPDMLITTPETLQAILPGRKIREHLKAVRWVVVDEVHELAEDERGVQLAVGLERLVELAGEFQRIGLSATVGSPSEVAQFLAGANRTAEIVDASATKRMQLRVEGPMPTGSDAELADKLFVDPMMVARLRVIKELMDAHGSTLMFVNTREAAEVLGSRFRMLDASMPIGVHHGSLAREVRIEAEERFRAEVLKGLICTSSMELGIDIGAVDLVVQYMSPRQVTRLTQRVGRSGHRVGELSVGVVVTANPDDAIEAAVISKGALTGRLERSRPHEGALDVLAHQLVGLSLDRPRVGIENALSLLRRAYPYRNFSPEQVMEVLEQLKAVGLVWVEGVTLERRRRGWEYYFSNLSMIPDTKRYHIHDLASRKSIGSLDEGFVASHCEPGGSFICKGEAWRVIDVEHEKDRVLVEPVEDPLGAIPAWEGELIPVPFEVAQEVGRVRGEVAERIRGGADPEAVSEGLSAEYPITKSASSWFVRLIEKQLEERLPVPTDRLLVVEVWKQFVVLHACFGSLANETLARVLAALLSARFGASVAVKVDPYRIAFKFPLAAEPRLVEDLLRELKPEHLEPILRIALRESPMFRWRLVHVAKRFGAIKRDAELARINLRRLARAFEGTPVYHETMREVMLEKLDIDKTEEVIRSLNAGAIGPTTIERGEEGGPTPLALQVLNELAGGELVVPKRAEREILRVLKHRLGQKRVRLFCMNCHSWSALRQVESLPASQTCGKCDARLLTVLPTEYRESLKAIRKHARGGRLRGEELRVVRRAQRAADLILAYGKPAVIALAARGVGPRTAARILAYQYRDEDDFYRAILRAEREFARTRRFWED